MSITIEKKLEALTRISETPTVPKKGQQAQEPTPEQQKDQFRKLFAEIDKRVFESEMYLKQELSRTMLARDLKTNIRYVTLAIKQETGCSFTQYINNYRVARAITLMRDMNDRNSVQKIALTCGYTTVSSFYRNFRSVTGQTPVAYLERFAEK